MAVVRKVQSRLNREESKLSVTEKKEPVSQVASSVEKESSPKRSGSKRYCHFCKVKSQPRYSDASTLRKFLNDRGRIYPRSRSGACAKHQRKISQEIKRARHLALLPFINRI